MPRDEGNLMRRCRMYRLWRSRVVSKVAHRECSDPVRSDCAPPAPSLVLAVPTVTCGSSPRNLSWTDPRRRRRDLRDVNVVGGKQNAGRRAPTSVVRTGRLVPRTIRPGNSRSTR